MSISPRNIGAVEVSDLNVTEDESSSFSLLPRRGGSIFPEFRTNRQGASFSRALSIKFRSSSVIPPNIPPGRAYLVLDFPDPIYPISLYPPGIEQLPRARRKPRSRRMGFQVAIRSLFFSIFDNAACAAPLVLLRNPSISQFLPNFGKRWANSPSANGSAFSQCSSKGLQQPISNIPWVGVAHTNKLPPPSLASTDVPAKAGLGRHNPDTSATSLYLMDSNVCKHNGEQKSLLPPGWASPDRKPSPLRTKLKG